MIAALDIATVEGVLLVGMVEEAFVRFLPLIATFYFWSYRRGGLLSKTEGPVATVASGATIAGLELVLKLAYLSRLEPAARFDALVLPVLFVHLPFALLAGRFAYALGEWIHGHEEFSAPTLSVGYPSGASGRLPRPGGRSRRLHRTGPTYVKP